MIARNRRLLKPFTGLFTLPPIDRPRTPEANYSGEERTIGAGSLRAVEKPFGVRQMSPVKIDTK